LICSFLYKQPLSRLRGIEEHLQPNKNAEQRQADKSQPAQQPPEKMSSADEFVQGTPRSRRLVGNNASSK
jgi:hypothetical protein